MKLCFLYQQMCRTLLVGLIGLNLNVQAGLLSVDAKDAANDIKNAGSAIVGDLSASGRALIKDISNKLLLTPVYAASAILIVGGMSFYHKALNDYFNTIDTQAEALQALRKKIKWKIIAGSTCLAVGIAILYKSQALATLCLGYVPEQASPIAAA